jgi:hypothetical protein
MKRINEANSKTIVRDLNHVQSMRSAASALRKVEQAAILWQKQEQGGVELSLLSIFITPHGAASHEAFMKYAEAIEELATKAMSGTPPSKEIGTLRARAEPG